MTSLPRRDPTLDVLRGLTIAAVTAFHRHADVRGVDAGEAPARGFVAALAAADLRAMLGELAHTLVAGLRPPTCQRHHIFCGVTPHGDGDLAPAALRWRQHVTMLDHHFARGCHVVERHALTCAPVLEQCLIGECRRLARRFIRRKTPEEKIFVLKGTTPAEILREFIAKIPGGELTIVGVGNEKGPGRLLTDYFGEAATR